MHWRLEVLRDQVSDFITSLFSSDSRRRARALSARLDALTPAERDLWDACWTFVLEHADEPLPPHCRTLLDKVIPDPEDAVAPPTPDP